MEYTKPPLDYDQQADKILERGLKADRSVLIDRLKSVSYYRLSGYWFPFQNPDNTYHADATLEKVWRRYTFDRHLRLLVLDAIERLEIAVRTDAVYRFSHRFGPFGYTEASRFPGLSSDVHAEFLRRLEKQSRDSQEQFVRHFKNKYGDKHSLPPLWMASEIMSFGNLMTFVRGLPRDMLSQISARFGIPYWMFKSWLRALNYTRNICAHHSRLWNRVLGLSPTLPKASSRQGALWHVPFRVPDNKVFGILTVLKYSLDRVAPQSQWPQRLMDLLDRYPDIPRQAMGMPENWRECGIWK